MHLPTYPRHFLRPASRVVSRSIVLSSGGSKKAQILAAEFSVTGSKENIMVRWAKWSMVLHLPLATTSLNVFMYRINVHYGSPSVNLKLDIYFPYAVPHPNLNHYTSVNPSSPTLHPIIVFIPSQTRPFSSLKWLFSSLGSNLSTVLSVMVVIPDLTPYPEGGYRHISIILSPYYSIHFRAHTFTNSRCSPCVAICRGACRSIWRWSDTDLLCRSRFGRASCSPFTHSTGGRWEPGWLPKYLRRHWSSRFTKNSKWCCKSEDICWRGRGT